MRLTGEQHAIMFLMVSGSWRTRPRSTIEGVYLGEPLRVTPEQWDALQADTVAVEMAIRALRKETP